jgi:hypothetical protein
VADVADVADWGNRRQIALFTKYDDSFCSCFLDKPAKICGIGRGLIPVTAQPHFARPLRNTLVLLLLCYFALDSDVAYLDAV